MKKEMKLCVSELQAGDEVFAIGKITDIIVGKDRCFIEYIVRKETTNYIILDNTNYKWNVVRKVKPKPKMVEACEIRFGDKIRHSDKINYYVTNVMQSDLWKMTYIEVIEEKGNLTTQVFNYNKHDMVEVVCDET